MARRKRSPQQREAQIREQVAAERDAALTSRSLSLRSGDNLAVEEECEKMLAAARRANPDEPTSYLSRDQVMLRRSKEVYNANGVPDASLVSGIYKRAYNPDFGSRPAKRGGGSDE